ncbi:ABC transporter substrate-binding protein [Streptomyces sp. NPDC003077]|uniref:ABC transporter substrate-binding protein n=1 Tax=Streptomyces sp. NPDC003077 TaxID=3154443 RepID=UPI0033A28A72
MRRHASRSPQTHPAPAPSPTAQPRRSRPHRAIAVALVSALTAAALTSCAEKPANADPDRNAGGTGKSITVGLTYTPDIQFAAFYMAEANGYYKDAGLNVTIRHHGAAEDIFGALKSGKEDVLYAGGTEMLQARSKNVPIVNVASFYQTYPVALIVPEDSPIKKPADLKGRTIGTPGPYGETYYGLLALLKEAGLKPQDADIKYIGFTQHAALTGKKVDGVMGYLSNDTVAFEESGKPVRSLKPASGNGEGNDNENDRLVGVGLGALKDTLGKRKEDIRAFVSASLRGLRYAIDHPEETVTRSQEFVPGLSDPRRRKKALAILKSTTALMRNDKNGLGHNDPGKWNRMADFMRDQGLLDKPVAPEEAYTNAYLRER